MKRLISWVLCVAMILSLTTNVFALDASDIEVKDDIDAGFIKISVVANGSTYQKGPYNTSFISNMNIFAIIPLIKKSSASTWPCYCCQTG